MVSEVLGLSAPFQNSRCTRLWQRPPCLHFQFPPTLQPLTFPALATSDLPQFPQILQSSSLAQNNPPSSPFLSAQPSLLKKPFPTLDWGKSPTLGPLAFSSSPYNTIRTLYSFTSSLSNHKPPPPTKSKELLHDPALFPQCPVQCLTHSRGSSTIS